MAIVYAVKSGNWSDPTVWNTGALPTTADDVRSNTFTVTVDGSYTARTITNRAETGVTSGGTFSLTSGVTLTASVSFQAGSNSAACVTFSLTAMNSASIVGTVVSTSAGSTCVLVSGSGTLNIIGQINTGAPNVYAPTGVSVTGAATVNITGSVANLQSGNTQLSYGINIQNSNAVVNVTGDLTPSPDYQTFSAHSCINSVGICTVTGLITGGNFAGLITANTSGSGIFKHIGTAIAGSVSSAIGGAVGTQIWLTGPILTNSTGVSPIYAPRWFWHESYTATPTYMEVRVEGSLALRNLFTADSVGGNPATSDVRAGITYGPTGGTITGTMAVPAAASVGYGVPVDNTTGTAAVSPADVWNYLTSDATTAGSMGERLKNSASVATVGNTWATD